MESLTLPTTAAQAKVFISPSSLSYPMSQADQTSDLSLPSQTQNGAGMNDTATAATNGAVEKETVTTGGVSGIVPILQ